MPSPPPPPPGLTLGDIYYIIFRHKWKIVILSSIGLVAALLLPLVWKRPYQSEAKLLIKYVLETKTPSEVGATDARVKPPEDGGENIINSELEILTSRDLALQVATNINIGPDKILDKAGGGADPQLAAALIHRNLLTDVPKKSKVVRILFQHPDPAIAQQVLTAIIEAYLKRHAEIHRAVSELDDFLSKETDQLKDSLKGTDEELRKKKNEGGFFSLEEEKKGLTDRMAKIQQAILDTEAELAERQAAVGELYRLLNLPPPAATNESAATTPSPQSGSGTNSQLSTFSSQLAGTSNTTPLQTASGTNSQLSTASSQANTNSQLSTSVPPAKLTEYKKVCSLLENLGKREQDLQVQFTPENAVLKSVQAQIATCERQKQQLEEEFPGLVSVKPPETKAAPGEAPAAPPINFIALNAKISALEAKIRDYNRAFEIIRSMAVKAVFLQGLISDLESKKVTEENNLKTYSSGLDQARIDAVLAALRDSNINLIQLPSPPFRDSTKLLKAMVGLLAGAIAAALGLAFLLELYFDRSLKRPIEIERTLGIPLFLSIPRMSLNGNGKAQSLKPAPKVPLLAERSRRREEAEPSSSVSSELRTPISELQSPTSDVEAHPASSIHNPENASNIQHPASRIAPPSHRPTDAPSHRRTDTPPSAPVSPAVLRPFFETLRDRLIAYFELKNLTHKPKLVAVTSCGEGAGVTTTAAGLAAALSETGEGNVLLVDMNGQEGAAHHFYKGNLECGLDDALEVDKRDGALVQDNLYVVTESASNGDPLPRVLPKRFKHLVPKLRASDYDYIIFDMPPVSQISATPRLARFMDMVFLVVESEKTDRDVVKRASALLAESQCNLGIVLNKNKSYVPKLLQQEL